MGTKLKRDTFPEGHRPDDFKVFGPPALIDGDFSTCKIADLGCFNQSGIDSNKYYHGAIVQSTINQNWYTYFEWGRTGATNPNFQFVECRNEADAQSEFADQLHDKNDKRGVWVTVAGKKVLQAKPNKDCYLVRPLATRTTGLPDAKTIKLNDGGKIEKVKVISSKPSRKIDHHTSALMRDLNVATVAYTKGSMADSSLPTQTSIDEARDYLQEAQKRLVIVGDDVDDQVADKDLVHLTQLMYGRIPKKKALHSPARDWILNQNNILMWQSDLDAFESALYATDIETPDADPFGGMPIHMEWVDLKSDLGAFLNSWWTKATNNRHSGIGSMKIKNLWKIDREGDHAKILSAQDKILADKPKIEERPLFQQARMDVKDQKRWHDSNTSLLFHGTRTVNVTGILRESLRLPRQLVGVAINGKAFGPGIYWADDWKKSAGYTSRSGAHWTGGSGGSRSRDAFMFAGDVALGSAFVAPYSNKGYTEAPNRRHSLLAKGGTCVDNNEWVVYDTKQCELKYLAEFVA